MTKFLIFTLFLFLSLVASIYLIPNLRDQDTVKPSVQLQDVTTSEQTYYPLVKGNRWEYEISNKEEQSGGSISATKEKEVVEVMSVRQDSMGEAFTLERRNKVDGTGKETFETETWLVRGRTIYDFGGGKIYEDTITYPFPFYVGQKWGDDEESLRYRDDGFYNWVVESKFPLKVLGKDYPECFRLVYNTLGSSGYEIFCYGLGVVEEGYKHNGTFQEWERKLVSALTAGQFVCLNITEEQAVKVTNDLPEVKEYLAEGNVKELRNGEPNVAVEGGGPTSDGKRWRTHVFSITEIEPSPDERPDSWTATFNWFQVDKCSGKVVCVDVDYEENESNLPTCTSI